MNKIEINKKDMQRLRRVQLSILIEIDRLCRNNNIKYSLSGGTLLGAVRHKGYIPWDDDIDIMMMRSDYDKFCKIARNMNSDKFYFVDAYGYKEYGYTFSKMMARNTLMKEISIAYNSAPDGVYVDIFPIDYCSEIESERKTDFNQIRKINRDMLCRGRYYFGQPLFRLTAFRINGYLLRLIPKSYFLKKYERIIYSSKSSNLVCSFSGTNKMEKETHQASIFSEYGDIEFEGHKFMAIVNYDKFLSTLYGDYMKLPPKEKQFSHHFVVKMDLKRY